MADEIKQLKAKRGTIKRAVKRFKSYIDSREGDNIDIFELHDRRSNFKLLLSQYNNIQDQIEILEEDSGSDKAIQEREEFEKLYYGLNSKAEKIINSASASISTNPDSQSFRNSLRLPEVNLPKFTGNYQEWYDFYNSFESLINANKTLSKVHKLQYLKSVLSGEAAEILSSLEITDKSYDCAWEMLKERYDNKRLIMNKHIRSIFDLPVMLKENHATLRQIVDGITKHVRILKSLDRPTDSWDDLIIYIISNKLDSSTIKEWEASLSKEKIPTLKELTIFLTKKCEILEVISRKNQPAVSANRFINSSNQKRQACLLGTYGAAANKIFCTFCNKDHSIYNCMKFKGLKIEDRIKEVQSRNLCMNCLRKGHTLKTCVSCSCRKCQEKHNTLLHLNRTLDGPPTAIENNLLQSNHSQEVTPAHSLHASLNAVPQVLFSTAIVNISDSAGNNHQCRALLDSGSQSCFITKSFAKRLNLPITPVNIPVSGINQTQSHICSKITVIIKSYYNSYKRRADCLILDRITEQLPVKSINATGLNIPKNIKLADPHFYTSNSIDLLIGVELFWDLLCVGQIRQGRHQPMFQKTQLGWIVSGHITSNLTPQSMTSCNLAVDSLLNEKLTQFWSIEEYYDKSYLSPEEISCEEHFLNTHHRNEDGRFIVKIPFKENGISSLGESRAQAEKRLFALERKFQRNQDMTNSYKAFIHEYIELGHMHLVSLENIQCDSSSSFYLPHHAVIKQSSLTTKLRVVFDGSAKSSTGISVNDIQLVGPVLQQDLVSIILRFRMHKYAITADIAKMYRQVIIDPSHRHLQRILWRDHPTDEIKTYELATVTYGTASAAFLAIRSLRRLAETEQNNYPVASEIALRDFYVDDLLTGANSKEEVVHIQQELCQMLAKGGFILRKWFSNVQEIMNNSELSIMNLDKNQTVSTLGLQWNVHDDTFLFSQPKYQTSTKITKRKILSNISQIFDPLGLIGPIITTSKVIMQQLWQSQITWDESVPIATHTEWNKFEKQLSDLSSLRIPRCVIPIEENIHIELHGFADASERAYGACIYVRVTNSQNQHSSTLLCSKSRVAPVKNISLPRLELCGALLLARLMKKVALALCQKIDRILFWTDSTIVLAWIKSTARNWKTFVANRVGEIQGLSNPNDWHHVRTHENPADLISRGSNLATLLNSNLWWHGASWLLGDYSEKINQSNSLKYDQEIPEQRTNTLIIAHTLSINDEIFKFSQFSKLIHVTAYCLRFRNNTKAKNQSERTIGPLSTFEICTATTALIKIVQASSFAEELYNLKKNKGVNKNSKLLSLNPFFDDNGIIRVGGRLHNASIPTTQKHPIVLPKTHIFTRLLVEYEHVHNLHAGPQATLTIIQQKYWIIRGRDLVRQVTRKCITCFRVKPRGPPPIMGALPRQRVTPSRPFAQCGVDYFGPINVRENRKRNYKTHKAYGAIFICLATKAIHIELVTDLTTEAFLGAMKRFMARRGKPHDIFSDNGTNFVGASHELQKLREMFIEDTSKNKIITAMISDNINWHFIPPRAPHFGGIWEAAVKSVKYHIRRVIRNACLTYEETYTFLVQIEAVLNSRPLIPLSNDPNDFAPLTPAHFLIGDLLTSNAEPELTTISVNRLSRWQYIEHLRQHFWYRWSKEYLSNLQIRNKWKTNGNKDLQPGQLVIIREDNCPPLQWHLGRIEEPHPGHDGVVRAATVRSSAGTFKRPAVKLYPLPIE